MKKKILLVEDQVILAVATQRELARYGYETIYVTTGEKAVDLVCNQHELIDLILMDIDLGRGIDGTEAARQILEIKEIPVVFFSSHEEPEIVEKTEKITSYGYVVKSSSITVLDTSIKMAFRLFESRREVAKQQGSLNRREKELQASQHAAQLGTWRLDIATGEVSWTDELYEVYGVDPSHFSPSYDDHAQFFMPESWQLLNATIDETLRTGRPYELELEKAKDGEPTGWMWVRGEVVRDDAGTIIELSGVAQDITKKKKTEEELRWREDLLNKTGELARIGGWEIDLTTNSVFWTQSTKSIHEVPMDYEPTVAEALAYFPGESGERLSRAVNRAIEEGVGYDLELDFVTAKGNTLKVRTIGNTEQGNGRCERVFGTVQDITQQKQHEDALLRGKEQFEVLVNSSPFPIGIADTADEKILYWSKSAQNMFGHHPKTVAEWFALAYPDPNYRQEVLRRWKQSLEGARQLETAVDTGEYQIMCKDGSIKPCQIYAQFTPDRLIVTFDDITERKQMENELRESAERYRNLIETIQEGIWQIDLNSNTTYVNQKMADMLGYAITEMMGQHLFSFMDNQGIEKANELLERREKGTKEQHDFEFITKGGSRIYLLLETTPIMDRNGDYYGSLAAAMDITDRKHAEEEIQRQLIEKETLLKEVNHRIKNNMAQVESLLSLQANSTDDPNVRSALHSAMSRVASTRALYEKLLIGEVYDHVSMRQYLEGIIDTQLEIFHDQSDVAIEKRIADFPLAPRDAIPIGIILNELLTNAFKYAFNGAPDGRVLVQLEKAESQVTLTVQDNGIGVSKRAEANQTPGFGVTIVSMLAEQLDGSFVMDGEAGTTCTVTLYV